MAFKIIRNDITKMTCDVIVNTAGKYPVDTFDEVGAGCDRGSFFVSWDSVIALFL